MSEQFDTVSWSVQVIKSLGSKYENIRLFGGLTTCIKPGSTDEEIKAEFKRVKGLVKKQIEVEIAEIDKEL